MSIPTQRAVVGDLAKALEEFTQLQSGLLSCLSGFQREGTRDLSATPRTSVANGHPESRPLRWVEVKVVRKSGTPRCESMSWVDETPDRSLLTELTRSAQGNGDLDSLGASQLTAVSAPARPSSHTPSRDYDYFAQLDADIAELDKA